MTPRDSISRRSFLAVAGAASLSAAAAKVKKVPIGLELYSVRKELEQDPQGTVRAVAKMGYQDVEFFSPYFSWTPEQAKEMRKLLDDLGIKCLSTHNDARAFTTDNIQKAIDLNKTIGSKYIVMASPGRVQGGADGWKKVAETLSQAADNLKAAKLSPGYHNHEAEFRPLDGGERPIDILARNTPKSVMLQLDVGTCLEMGQDPVAWIDKNPGRIRSMHCKDWSPDKGYEVLFGEGKAPWKEIFQVAEKTGGIEFYLIEQEGSAYPPLDTAERCLANFKKLHV